LKHPVHHKLHKQGLFDLAPLPKAFHLIGLALLTKL